MKLKNKKVGDILFNPCMGDLWFLNKVYNEEKKKEVWTLNLIHDDLQEELEYVLDFIRVGNIYEMVEEKLEHEKLD